MNAENLKAYELIEKRRSEDLNSETYLLKHKKTGARIALIENDDENKVFYIGFRTPPEDSTGVAHILEHSVLCGSKEFPVKDPFVELVKGSLNTFLNAMTYPDKTLYPVASCNDKDFQNLMHVYLDAVFYPNVRTNESIFRQEGWRYELEKPEDELTLNGVVYNEMKGAFSNPDEVAFREMQKSLFPDNTYGKVSGGDPEVIPDLSYERFLEFYGKLYHPSNSYIYLYGNMDMEEKLKYIDEQYLSHFDYREVDSCIKPQKPFEKPIRVEKTVPLNEGEDIDENTYLTANYVVGDCFDRDLYVAMQVVDYALCSAPGAPLKKALVDKGLGKDVYSSYNNGVMQPFFSIVSQGVNADCEKEFLDTIDEELKRIVDKGFDKKALRAAINYFEFRYREADYGSYPKGLMWGLEMMHSWLYDEKKPFIHIEALDTFARLKEKVDQGYFESLVKKYLLDNSHKSVVVIKPEYGLQEKREKDLKEKLAAYKATLSDAEIAKIIEIYKKVEEFREKEDAKEDLEKIPLLAREDLKKEAAKYVIEEKKIGDTKYLYHDIFTNGIGYLHFFFDLRNIPEEYYPYIGILKGCLMLLNTENYSYGDLFNEINLWTGGIEAGYFNYTKVEDPDCFSAWLGIKARVLDENMNKAFELLEEILLTSDFTDEKRLKEILAEGKMRMQGQMTGSANWSALGRAESYGSVGARLEEEVSGIEFYRLVADLDEHFEEKKEDLKEKLKTLAKMIFRSENLLVDFTGSKETGERFAGRTEEFKKKLYTCEVKKEAYIPTLEKKNEGFMTAGQVQYVCRAGNFKKRGLPYTGALKVLKVMLGYEYLWVNVRVKGGAYGCMCGFGKDGSGYFVSYRDPNLDDTVEIYEKAADAIAEYQADERTMTKYIIGAISGLDTPMTPPTKGLFALAGYLAGITEEMLQKERDEILSATADDIRKLSAHVRAFMEDDQFCVIGNAGKIKEEEKKFKKIENLF